MILLYLLSLIIYLLLLLLLLLENPRGDRAARRADRGGQRPEVGS